MSHEITVLATGFETHDVKRLITSRPEGFSWAPGQSVQLAVRGDGSGSKGRPFTPANLPDDRVVEFIIKKYADGVTARMHELGPGDTLEMSAPFGAISYHGPGVFIAGGAGITPFLAILRDLARKGELGGQTLLFSNRTPADVICERELRHLLGERCVLACTREGGSGYERRRIDREFLAEKITDHGQRFYVCGPPAFVKDVNAALEEAGVTPDHLVA